MLQNQVQSLGALVYINFIILYKIFYFFNLYDLVVINLQDNDYPSLTCSEKWVEWLTFLGLILEKNSVFIDLATFNVLNSNIFISS